VIKVVVADDQVLVRAGLAALLRAAPGLDVVGEAEDGEQALAIAAEQDPDVVLMDVRMPGMGGIAATEQLVAAREAAGRQTPRVLILTTFDLDDYVYAALRGGASGFLLKDTPPAELLAAIRVIAAGEALLGPSITRRLIDEFANHAEPAGRTDVPRLATITAREHEVLLLVADGRSNAEIAETLHIEIGTAKTHVAHLLTKLDARDRIHLVILAFRAGLVRAA